ncbi:MAG: hypothetical protein BMS9Abin02_1645 [Anaerolineae bacterium]|nr:MAG: hypothetical protein BMS9Abin02_1645 [Anaerolineae bacterium]
MSPKSAGGTFPTLKTELVHIRNYSTLREAKSDNFEYFDVFNTRKRLHSVLGHKSLIGFKSYPLLLNYESVFYCSFHFL